MKLQQVELYDANTQSRMFCWLEARRVKPSNIVTLKGIKGDWIVMHVYKTEREDSEIERRWQVGGLR